MSFNRKIVSYALLIGFLLPVLLFAFLGQFSRLMSDDYCTIAIGQELGAWDGMVYWFTTWAGSYSNFFFKSAIAPLDTLAPMITPTLIIVVWMIGLFVLIWQLLKLFGIRQNQAYWSFVLTSVIVFATLNALYSPQSLYWFAASTHYTLPLAILTLAFGMMLAIATAPSWTAKIWFAWVICGVLCFLSAGASEIFVAFQSALMTLVVGLTLLFIPSQLRKRWLLAVSIGWVVTILSLGIQLSSPGVMNRVETEAESIDRPLTSIAEIVPATISQTFEFIGHREAFAGFFVLLCLTFILTWRVYQPEKMHLSEISLRIPFRYVLGCTVINLLYVPILWQHDSNMTQLFGRFSYGYFLVIVLHGLFLLICGLILFRRRWIEQFIGRHAHGWHVVYVCIGCIVIGLFAMTQLRSVHFKATNYLFVSVILLLGAIAWQLSSVSSSSFVGTLKRAVIVWHGCVLILIAAVVFTALYGRGFVTPRILSPVSYLLVTLGVVWGGYLGYLLKRYHVASAFPLLLRLGGLVLLAGVLSITSVGIVLGHASLIPNFQSYAEGWDLRDARITAVRRSGETSIAVYALPFDLADWIDVTDISDDPANRCALDYYEMESIIELGDTEP